jgi:hypothetical protein
MSKRITRVKNPKWSIEIWFQPDDKGNLYELQSIKLKTKPMTMDQAQELAIKEAEKCWPHYEIELSNNV